MLTDQADALALVGLRRVVGADLGGHLANELAQAAITRESDLLEREIRNLKTELELRHELANNAPMMIIQRHGRRAAGSRGVYEGDPLRNRLDLLQQPGGTP